MSVLVVDDDEHTRSAVEAILRNHGASVVAVSSGEQALRLLSESSFQVLLTDIDMPGIDGCELLRRICTLDGVRSSLRAIAFSGACDGRQRDLVDRVGFDAFLPKPSTASGLVQALGSVREDDPG